MSGPVHLVVRRGRSSLAARLDRLRSRSWQVGQCAVAAGMAWLVAADVLHHPAPVFAPIAALLSLGTTYGQRLRRIAEVTLGVALGVAVGDLFTHLVGTGVWQIALLVAASMVAALLLDAGVLFVNQAAIQAIVVVVLIPGNRGFLRWTDAVVGGVVALVAAAVVPRAPLRRPRHSAAEVVRRIAVLLDTAAASMRDGGVDRSLEILGDARATDVLIGELRAAADEGLSVVAASPFRFRHRGHLRQLSDLVEPLDFALRNTRVLVRRVAVACYRDESLPESLVSLVLELSGCCADVATELGAGHQPVVVQERLLALGQATAQTPRPASLSGEVVLAQVRSIVADLLAVSGMDRLEATEVIPPAR